MKVLKSGGNRNLPSDMEHYQGVIFHYLVILLSFLTYPTLVKKFGNLKVSKINTLKSKFEQLSFPIYLFYC